MSAPRSQDRTGVAATPHPRRMRRLLGMASLATAGLVAAGVLTASGTAEPNPSTPDVVRASLGSVTVVEVEERRVQRLSRKAKRVSLEPRAVGHKWATAPLNLWTRPGEQGWNSGVAKKGRKLAVTGQVLDGWAEVLLGERLRYVNAEYLASTKPKPKPKPRPAPEPVSEQEATSDGGDAARTESASEGSTSAGGLSTAPCPHGSGVESGITSAAAAVYRAVCAAFPQPTSYGGYDPHGEHVDGRAIDIMVSGSLGWQIAEWLRANAGALQLRNVIYSQKIWSSERAGEGWRSMEDRGDPTANHFDHVHVAVH